jgi:hypothetical protein
MELLLIDRDAPQLLYARYQEMGRAKRKNTVCAIVPMNTWVCAKGRKMMTIHNKDVPWYLARYA